MLKVLSRVWKLGAGLGMKFGDRIKSLVLSQLTVNSSQNSHDQFTRFTIKQILPQPAVTTSSQGDLGTNFMFGDNLDAGGNC